MRTKPHLVTSIKAVADLRKRLSVIQDANVLTIPPPPVQGLGSAGGFKMMLEDRAGLGSDALDKAARALVAAAVKEGRLTLELSESMLKKMNLYAPISGIISRSFVAEGAFITKEARAESGMALVTQLMLSAYAQI